MLRRRGRPPPARSVRRGRPGRRTTRRGRPAPKAGSPGAAPRPGAPPPLAPTGRARRRRAAVRGPSWLAFPLLLGLPPGHGGRRVDPAEGPGHGAVNARGLVLL